MTLQNTNNVELPWGADDTASDANRDGILKRLQALDEGIGPDASKPERAKVLIAACIGEGVTCGAHIRAILADFELDRQFLQLIMNRGAGSDPARFLWRKDAKTNAYSLLDNEPVRVNPISAALINIVKPVAAMPSVTI